MGRCLAKATLAQALRRQQGRGLKQQELGTPIRGGSGQNQTPSPPFLTRGMDQGQINPPPRSDPYLPPQMAAKFPSYGAAPLHCH